MFTILGKHLPRKFTSMIFAIIICVSLIQFLLYRLNSTYKIRFGDSMIPFIVLLCHFFVFPRLFYQEVRTDGLNCGMPTLGITFAFWVFGTLAVIAAHMVWKFYSKKYNSVQQDR